MKETKWTPLPKAIYNKAFYNHKIKFLNYTEQIGQFDFEKNPFKLKFKLINQMLIDHDEEQ